MVLLTSSTVSALISGGVVCLFTFLLFLSGYVLQQQSVRSIQEAIRRPPEPQPVPTLPPQFREPENETVGVALEPPERDAESVIGGSRGPWADSVQVPVVASTGEQKPRKDSPPQRLAYIFALEEPLHLCSALLFAKQQRSASRLPQEPSIVLLYPSTWESDPSPLFTSVLSFMRDVQELYDVVYRPVQIRDAWNTRALLLGELQWGRWDYDQALYLRSPGMGLDIQTLDSTLASLDTRQSWTPLNPSSGDDPEVLLRTSRGLQSPRGPTRKLIVSANHRVTEADEGGESADTLERDSAYMLFSDQRPSDESQIEWYGDLKHQFHEGRRTVCEGSGLLSDTKMP
ncbi:hypothetical protein A1O7_08362 [Cladophialophora yegresii CBS 114405]|uniref:Uncharacterized protein n=1 Tax=Cladophialophora yegresii CBS 114405 TaxID=1182544 RepID=W9VR01_9EURO|nr:uncharacterized protein A1O7_08362 [Cladophialophora yegresii CBS 114405]EXJ55435.1 hypothetical protein A1O7_08362 [Cladophialophora yegresii CBS 114405]